MVRESRKHLGSCLQLLGFVQNFKFVKCLNRSLLLLSNCVWHLGSHHRSWDPVSCCMETIATVATFRMTRFVPRRLFNSHWHQNCCFIYMECFVWKWKSMTVDANSWKQDFLQAPVPMLALQVVFSLWATTISVFRSLCFQDSTVSMFQCFQQTWILRLYHGIAFQEAQYGSISVYIDWSISLCLSAGLSVDLSISCLSFQDFFPHIFD